jgi:hypothetical protein
MNNLPARLGDDLPGQPRQLAKAIQAQEKTELAIYEHHLLARYSAETDHIDSAALGDAVRASLDEELSLLDWGLERANGSAAKAELVSRKVSLLSTANSRRIVRRFGG